MPRQARLDACPLPSSGFRFPKSGIRTPEFRRIGNSPELAMLGKPLVPFIMHQVSDSGELNWHLRYRTSSCRFPLRPTWSALPSGDFGAQYCTCSSPLLTLCHAITGRRRIPAWQQTGLGARAGRYSLLRAGLDFG